MKLNVLLITGGHGFEREPFFAMWQSLAGVTYREVEYPEAEVYFTPERAAEFDAFVYYDFGQTMSERAQRDFSALLQRGKGMVFLHHALLGHANWPEYVRIVGGAWIDKERVIDGRAYAPSQYSPNQNVAVQIAAPEHPVTAGVKNFELVEETYKNLYIAPDVTPLLTTKNPTSESVLGWVRQHARSRIVYLQPGHGATAFNDSNYRQLLRQAIEWAAGN